MKKFKLLSVWLFSALLLVITIIGAMAVEDGSVDLKQVYLEDDLLKIEYEPVFNNNALVVCEVLIDNTSYINNIISVPNKVNRISEVDSFDEGEYLFLMRCVQNELLFESTPYLLKFTDDVVSEDAEEIEKKSFLNDPKGVFFTLIVLVAAIIIIKSLTPKVDKKKNKRLRRFA